MNTVSLSLISTSHHTSSAWLLPTLQRGPHLCPQDTEKEEAGTDWTRDGAGKGGALGEIHEALEHHGRTPVPTWEKSIWAWLKEMPLMLGSGRLCSLSHSAKGRLELRACWAGLSVQAGQACCALPAQQLGSKKLWTGVLLSPLLWELPCPHQAVLKSMRP